MTNSEMIRWAIKAEAAVAELPPQDRVGALSAALVSALLDLPLIERVCHLNAHFAGLSSIAEAFHLPQKPDTIQ